MTYYDDEYYTRKESSNEPSLGEIVKIIIVWMFLLISITIFSLF